eukprot:2714632-Prymnesium_polylepis.1
MRHRVHPVAERSRVHRTRQVGDVEDVHGRAHAGGMVHLVARVGFHRGRVDPDIVRVDRTWPADERQQRGGCLARPASRRLHVRPLRLNTSGNAAGVRPWGVCALHANAICLPAYVPDVKVTTWASCTKSLPTVATYDGALGFARLYTRIPSLDPPTPPSRYRKPLVVSMATLWVEDEPAEPVIVAATVTDPVARAERSTTRISGAVGASSVTRYAYVPYVLTSFQTLDGEDTRPTTVALCGLVTSTTAIPVLYVISAYSRPDDASV